LEPLREAVVGDVRPTLLVLLGAVGLFLLIAGANAAALVLSRGLARGRELGIRTVLGAGRERLVRQVLFETLTLALAAGVAGIALAAGALRVLRSTGALALPRAESLGIDLRVAGFGLGLAVAVGLVFGLAPALRLSRGGLGGILREGAVRVSGAPRARSALVVAQIALAVILTVGAGLLGRSLWSLLAVEPGFDPEGVLLAEIKLPESRYPAPRSAYPRLPEVLGFYDRALERVAAIPGVAVASAAANHPMQRGWTSRTEAEGYVPPPGPPDEARIRPVAPGYFEAVGVELLRGRAIEVRDRVNDPPVLVINRAFAERYFAGRDPIGRTVAFWDTPRQVVGVVADVRFAGLGEPVEPAVYPALHQLPMGQFSLVLKTAMAPLDLADELRAAVAEIDPDLALFNVRSLEQAVAETLGRPRFELSLMAVYALLALALAAIGVYGLVAQAVLERTREIGVRMALGADRRRVLRLVLGGGAALAGLGVALGLVGASLLTRLAASLLHGVRPLDPATFATVAAVLAAVALAAAALPAWRATRVDPVTALRQE
ncbi:MAG TPA: FtsX-like permease family protein, partial [Thermoanaerobaculia bacterium]|nr:FtsX-like permease family protein [Thermoanaerobaculia bacterium]